MSDAVLHGLHWLSFLTSPNGPTLFIHVWCQGGIGHRVPFLWAPCCTLALGHALPPGDRVLSDWALPLRDLAPSDTGLGPDLSAAAAPLSPDWQRPQLGRGPPSLGPYFPHLLIEYTTGQTYQFLVDLPALACPRPPLLSSSATDSEAVPLVPILSCFTQQIHAHHGEARGAWASGWSEWHQDSEPPRLPSAQTWGKYLGQKAGFLSWTLGKSQGGDLG